MWRPINTAPKDGTRILLWWDGDLAPVAWWEAGEWQYAMSDVPFSDVFVRRYQPTHWAPAPSTQ